MHGASGYRVRTDAEHATPLAGPTYRARTRYRLAGPVRQARSCQRGRENGPLSRVGILALQRGEDVKAVAKAHDEDVLDQLWVSSEDINTDALDGLFQERKLKMTLQFEADSTTATITADASGKPLIKIESHR